MLDQHEQFLVSFLEIIKLRLCQLEKNTTNFQNVQLWQTTDINEPEPTSPFHGAYLPNV